MSQSSLRLEVVMSLETAVMLVERGGLPLHDRTRIGTRALREEPEILRKVAPAFGVLYEPSLDGALLPLRDWSVTLSAPNEVTFLLDYAMGEGVGLSLRALHLAILSEGYTSAVSVSDSTASSGARSQVRAVKVLHAADRTLKLTLPKRSPAVSTLDPSRQPPAEPVSTFPSDVELGIEYFVMGYDRLLFLLGLALACAGLKQRFARRRSCSTD